MLARRRKGDFAIPEFGNRRPVSGVYRVARRVVSDRALHISDILPPNSAGSRGDNCQILLPLFILFFQRRWGPPDHLGEGEPVPRYRNLF